jgi:hypothetical protein
MTDVRGRLNKALADRYHIERELGQGGMATVYLAEDVRHKRKVALKAGTSWRRLESALPLIPISADSAKPVPGLTPRDQLSRWSPALADRYRIEREMGQDGMGPLSLDAALSDRYRIERELGRQDGPLSMRP